MSLKTNEEYEQRRTRQVSRIRGVLDYTMGILIIGIGLFLVFRSAINIKLNKIYPPDVWDKVYGILVILYGSWRLYRGYKKK
ncbi:hypothetical protein U0035_08210 [Niabella yanshanensis]|uniref:Uncharacterized protein n=1 Tax=Niabella yanshanensis TaxID=577386 RepID=A0ABZ0WAE9_9BACT|nr:hypothetical protein [Niabella yanshanensis]WQD40126.1 hypothetical protein U0035_08210 [Niabella yanshanensis]